MEPRRRTERRDQIRSSGKSRISKLDPHPSTQVDRDRECEGRELERTFPVSHPVSPSWTSPKVLVLRVGVLARECSMAVSISSIA